MDARGDRGAEMEGGGRAHAWWCAAAALWWLCMMEGGRGGSGEVEDCCGDLWNVLVEMASLWSTLSTRGGAWMKG